MDENKAVVDTPELAGKIGENGSYEVNVTPDGRIQAKVGLEFDIFAWLEGVAAKTGTKLDDQVVAGLKKLLGRA